MRTEHEPKKTCALPDHKMELDKIGSVMSSNKNDLNYNSGAGKALAWGTTTFVLGLMVLILLKIAQSWFF